MAGLVCYYNSVKFHYLYVTSDEAIGTHLRVMSCAARYGRWPMSSRRRYRYPARGPVELRVEVDDERLRFAYRVDDGAWQWLPQQFDASMLSDEATAPGAPNFTGAFVGMACQDLAGTAMPADFDWFEYRERAYLVDPSASL